MCSGGICCSGPVLSGLERLQTHAAELAVTGQVAKAYRADASDPEGLSRAINRAIDKLGAPDVLVYEVKRWLRRAGKKLWARISRPARVKEWTLTGKVGFPLLGFAEASISMTFG